MKEISELYTDSILWLSILESIYLASIDELIFHDINEDIKIKERPRKKSPELADVGPKLFRGGSEEEKAAHYLMGLSNFTVR